MTAAPSVAKPSGREWLAVLALVGALLVFNLATSRYYPAVWCDEVSFSEPAINLVQRGSFTTFVWQYQPPDTFPVLNCPLYSLSLVPWVKLAGASLLAVRAFNYVLMAAAAFLVWIISWRQGLVKSAPARLGAVALLHLGYGISFAYRCSRPDILGLISLLLLLLAFTVRRSPWRELALFAAAFLTTWIGLQVALFAGFAAFVAWFPLRRVKFRELVLLASGMAAGAGLLASFFASKGLLGYYLPSVIGLLGKHYAHSHLAPGAAAWMVVISSLASYVTDFSALAFALGLGLLRVAAPERLTPATRDLVRYSLILFFAVPTLFTLAGHYAFYYTYMVFVPLTVAFFAAYAEFKSNPAPVRARWLPWAAALVPAIAALTGLPLRMGLAFATSTIVPRSEISRTVVAHVKPGDVAYADLAAYFEVKQVAPVVYDLLSSSEIIANNVPGRTFTAEEKQAVSVLVVRPAQAPFFFKLFGGEWTPVTEPFGDSQDFSKLSRLPVVGPRFVHYSLQPQTERYQVQIFRRAGNPAPAAPP